MSAPSTPAVATDNAPWWKDLTPYHWFVFAMASLAWLFDCLDQQLFILARNFAMESLLPKGMDPVAVTFEQAVELATEKAAKGGKGKSARKPAVKAAKPKSAGKPKAAPKPMDCQGFSCT